MNSHIYMKSQQLPAMNLVEYLATVKVFGNWLSKPDDYWIIGLLVAVGERYTQQVLMSSWHRNFFDDYLILQRKIIVSRYNI